MKIGMIGIVTNLSTRLSSHNAGWTLVCKSVLETKFGTEVEVLDNKCDYSGYDILVINEGVNYKEGSFNFFGGVQEKQIESLVKLSSYKGITYSVNSKVDYNALLTKRKELRHLDLSFPIPEVIDLSKVNSKLVLGDSHSLSVFKPGYSISRNDGKTLHGFLKIGIEKFIKEDTTDLVFYAGNIDIRFHTHNHGGEEAIKKMSIDLFNQISKLTEKGIKVTLVHLIPCEDESRKIPGTGKYKGENFFGSKEERISYVTYFNSLIDRIAIKLNLDVIYWQFDYENGLSFDDMEAKQSVHIRPSSYKYINQLTKEKNDTGILKLL